MLCFHRPSYTCMPKAQSQILGQAAHSSMLFLSVGCSCHFLEHTHPFPAGLGTWLFVSAFCCLIIPFLQCWCRQSQQGGSWCGSASRWPFFACRHWLTSLLPFWTPWHTNNSSWKYSSSAMDNCFPRFLIMTPKLFYLLPSGEILVCDRFF